MSQTESISDSDSSTSSSWVYVDDCTPESSLDKNKYYLNCSSEPIQELSQYLNCTSPEQETDSDSISVISDSDDAQENLLSEEVAVIENIPIQVVKPQELHQTEIKNSSYFNKYVIIGWILVSVMTPLLLDYISNYAEEVLGNHPDNVAIDIASKLLTADKEIDVMKDQLNKENTITEITQDEDQTDNKRKYDSKGEIEYHRLDYKAYSSDQKEPDNLKIKKTDENYRKGEFTKDELYNFRTGFVLKENSLNIIKEEGDNIYNNKNKKIKSPVSKNTAIDTELNYENMNNSNKYSELKKKKIKKQKHLSREDLSNPNKNFGNYLLVENAEQKTPGVNNGNVKKKSDRKKSQKEKKFNLKPDEFLKKKIKKRQKKKKQKKDDKTEDFSSDIKELRNLLKEKDRNIRELTKAVKSRDKHLKILEYKILRELNMLRKSKNMYWDEKIYDKVNNTSGEWYYRLYKGRSKLRNRQHASDWVFERADFRNKKRNMKHNWYWNWMSNREQLRL